MDLNFHYYAVKTLAILAGFSEEQGQIIANYSQFVDDFTNYRKMFFSQVPEFAQHLAKKQKLGWLFSPVTTGFESWFDMARLITETNQKNITIPFHFIPPHDKLNEKKEGNDRIAWRVIPAHMNTDSLIRELMLDAQHKFQSNPNTRENLIRIGLLVHIFADTYAHQNFSGFWGWENYCTLTLCCENDYQENLTKYYFPSLYHLLPAIGHTEVNHAPDDSNIYFEMKMQFKEKGDYDFEYSRSNASEFSIASREIINYLTTCLGKSSISEREWDKVSPKLGKGFLTSFKNPYYLNLHWKDIFPSIDYHYNKDEMMKDMLEAQPETNCLSLTEETNILIKQLANQGIEVDPVLYATKNDDFFHFNVIAGEVRNFVNGKDVALEQLAMLENALNKK